MDQSIEGHLIDFESRFWYRPRTVRNHWLRWIGFVEQAKLNRKHGLLLDLNYVSSVAGNGLYMSGSGLPIKFVDENGKIIDVWQQATHVEDDTVMTGGIFWGLKLDQAVSFLQGAIEQSLALCHSPLVLNVHPQFMPADRDPPSREFLSRILAFAAENAVPIVSAEDWLAFTQARYQAQFDKVEYQGEALAFSLCRIVPEQKLSIVIPWKYGAREISRITVNESSTEYARTRSYGKEYAIVRVGKRESCDFRVEYR